MKRISKSDNNNNSNNNKKLKINKKNKDIINSVGNNNNNNKNNYSNNIVELFFKVWRNLIIKNNILKYLRLFNKYEYFSTDRENSLVKHPYREFISSLYYGVELSLYEGLIPANVKELSLEWYSSDSIEPNQIPQSVVKFLSKNNNNQNTQPLVKGSLPKMLEELKLIRWGLIEEPDVLPSICLRKFEYDIYSGLKVGILPSCLVELNLTNYNDPLEVGILPSSLKTLKLLYFNHPLEKDVLPLSLTELELSFFNKPLKKHDLPPLKSLFLKSFNHPLDFNVLPESIESLKMFRFNHPLVPGFLPLSVKELNLSSFNHPLTDSCIPNSVTSLNLWLYDIRPLNESIIPNSTKSLALGRFNESLGNIELSSITHLHLGYSFDNCSLPPHFIPNSVASLRLEKVVIKPPSFSQVPFSFGFGSTPMALPTKEIDLSNIPKSTTELVLGNRFNAPIKPFSLDHTNIKKLEFGNSYNQSIKHNVIPNTVTDLSFSIEYNLILLPGVIPNSVKTLYLSENYNMEIKPNVLPNNLEHLKFGFYYNQLLYPNVLPSTLKSISFGWCYYQQILPNSIPSECHSLEFKKKFEQVQYQILPDSIPPSVKSIKYGSHKTETPVRKHPEFEDFNSLIF